MAALLAAAGVGAFVIGLAAAPGAQAAQVFNFTGTCIDCAGDGLGSLTLAQTPNGALTKSDFLSFSYKSSLLSFNLNSADIAAVVGSLNPDDLGHTYIDIIQLGGTGWEFTRNSDGSWSVSSDITHGAGNKGGGGGGGFFFSSGGGGGGSASVGNLGGDSATFNGGGGQRSIDDFGPISRVSQAVISAVPEPAAWALMILGFGGVGAVLRRRRRGFAGVGTA
jgi:hypothetical protein